MIYFDQFQALQPPDLVETKVVSMIASLLNDKQLNFLVPDLIDQLYPRHPLLKLAENIPWEVFESEFAPLYS